MSDLRILTRAQLDQFHEQGFLTVPGVFPAERMDRALEASDRLVYGMDFATWSRRVRDGEPLPLIGEGVGANFPTGLPELDGLVENETYLDIACDLLGTDDIHYVNGHLFVRSGPIDRRHAQQPWEGFHIDHASGSFLPPWTEVGRYDYIGSGVLLHDVDEDCAPTVMIPGSHRAVTRILPRLHEEGRFQPHNTFTDIRGIPEFTARASLTGSKGSATFNQTYLVHAAIPFADRRKQRSFWTMSIGRAANATCNRLGNVFSYEQRGAAIPFWKRTTPRVRSLFGWPKPGDPYYTEESLRLLAICYPGMDLSPYAERLATAASSAGGAARAGTG
jgi:hypothetical protein